MEVVYTLDELEGEFLLGTWGKSVRTRRYSDIRVSYFDDLGTEAIGARDFVHVPLEIQIEELENEVQLRFGVNDVQKPSSHSDQSQPSKYFRTALPNA